VAFSLPALPYAYDALAPAIDEETMRLHHGIHHAGYTNKLNKAIMGTAYEGQKVDTLLKQLDSLPGNIQADVQNFGGGYANHCLFWQIMGPDEGGTPDGVFADVIHDRFDGFDDFKKEFQRLAATLFGAGWTWLVVDPQLELQVYSLPNQDSPLSLGDVPILCVDVWEHAYYKQYGPNRAEYLSNWWDVVRWSEVSRLYECAKRDLSDLAGV
tara:strand:- start:17552 stop:18187 length:636 start_codon:yes stop_codon:yes gene_type:complete